MAPLLTLPKNRHPGELFLRLFSQPHQASKKLQNSAELFSQYIHLARIDKMYNSGV
jgi:hypothetical protein